jgi:hypothetical protein
MKYEIRKRKDGKEAIFDENGKMISPEWFDEIHPYGLVRGQSPYHTDIRFVSNPYRDVINCNNHIVLQVNQIVSNPYRDVIN